MSIFKIFIAALMMIQAQASSSSLTPEVAKMVEQRTEEIHNHINQIFQTQSLEPTIKDGTPFTVRLDFLENFCLRIPAEVALEREDLKALIKGEKELYYISFFGTVKSEGKNYTCSFILLMGATGVKEVKLNYIGTNAEISKLLYLDIMKSTIYLPLSEEEREIFMDAKSQTLSHITKISDDEKGHMKLEWTLAVSNRQSPHYGRKTNPLSIDLYPDGKGGTIFNARINPKKN
jgi:hypothetical protein